MVLQMFIYNPVRKRRVHLLHNLLEEASKSISYSR